MVRLIARGDFIISNKIKLHRSDCHVRIAMGNPHSLYQEPVRFIVPDFEIAFHVRTPVMLPFVKSGQDERLQVCANLYQNEHILLERFS
jgi:hypothetical protein